MPSRWEGPVMPLRRFVTACRAAATIDTTTDTTMIGCPIPIRRGQGRTEGTMDFENCNPTIAAMAYALQALREGVAKIPARASAPCRRRRDAFRLCGSVVRHHP